MLKCYQLTEEEKSKEYKFCPIITSRQIFETKYILTPLDRARHADFEKRDVSECKGNLTRVINV